MNSFRRAAGPALGLGLAILVLWSPGRVSPVYAAAQITITPYPFSPPGSGTITSRDGFVHCVVSNGVVTGTCAPIVEPGSSITLDVNAAADSDACEALSGTCQGAFTTIVLMDQNVIVNNYGFKQVRPLIHVNLAGNGSGTVTGTGINCPDGCSAWLPFGTSVTLTANPAPGSHFSSWDNESPCGNPSSPTCAFQVSSEANMYVTFLLNPATPPPSSGPTPDASPTASSAPQSPHPSASVAASTPSPSDSHTRSTPGPGGSNGSGGAGGSQLPADGSGALSGSSGVPTGPDLDPAGLTTDGPAGPTSAGPLPLVLAVVVAGALVGLGLALRRSRPRGDSQTTPP